MASKAKSKTELVAQRNEASEGIKPLAGQVIVRRRKPEETTKGGIVLPERSRNDPRTGVIVSVGAPEVLDSGDERAADVAPGDVVLFRRFDIEEVEVAGEPLLVVPARNLVAVLTD